MNRRELMAAMSVFPFVGKQKVRLDRVTKIIFTDINQDKIHILEVNSKDTYFYTSQLKDVIKTYNEVVLEDGNKNILKVNKLNKGLVLLKLDLIK